MTPQRLRHARSFMHVSIACVRVHSMATQTELEATSLSMAQDQVLNHVPVEVPVEHVSRIRKTTVTFQLSCINFAWNATKGLTIIGLPRMTADLNLPPTLAFWPSSVPSLATASTLLLAGAIGDVLGPKYMNLGGCILNGCFMIACGLSRHGEELVVLRALSGVAQAMHLSTSAALVSKVHEPGKGRNLSFACLGMSQVLGFSFGLVVGGILIDTSGWRSGWFLYGAIILTASALGFWSLPNPPALGSRNALRHNLYVKVDWIGALLASIFMALVSYFLA
jgi:MFS family permease